MSIAKLMVPLIVAGLLYGNAAWAVEQETSSQDDLEKGFVTLPHEAKPWVYWWFEGGYGHPEGMARDIAAMKEKGIGGVMHMQTINSGGLPLPQEPKMLSPEWDAWFGEMLRLGHEGGMSLSASILDGWSHGGWWIGKEDGAKQLVYSETQVDGPSTIQAPLPQPFTRLDVYHDVAVVAYKEKNSRPLAPLQVTSNNVRGGYCGEENWPAIHAMDFDQHTYWRIQTPCTPENPAILDLKYAQPVKAVSALLQVMPFDGPAEGELQVSDDGKAFRRVCEFTMQLRENKELTFPETTGSVFRLIIRRAYGADMDLAEFQLFRAGDTHYYRPGIKWWEFKSGNRAWWGWPPNPYEALEEVDSYNHPGDLTTTELVDLSSKLKPDGTLDWQVPVGRWTVLRFGWTPLAEPARMGSGGYEADVLNTKAADLMMDTAAKRMHELSVAKADNAPILFHTDSWEIGAGGKGQQPTWTNDFREQFQKRRGYDLLPYLPALARQIVDNHETTERFLRDYRDTIADLLADYYGHLQKRAHEMNGGINSESGYGSYPHPHMDGLKIFGRADRPMAEFWHPFGTYSSEYLQYVDIMRTTASGARIYGNRFVQAETLTFNPTAGLFTPPSQYRRTLHEAWARGLNQAVVHKYTHQPIETKPGMLDYDIFNRNFSWWPLADGILGYMGRCQYLLQQGDFVGDVLYFVGEGSTRYVPGREFLNPSLPQGYDYDGINTEVLLTRLSVKNGMLHLPACKAEPGAQSGDGMHYRYLVLCEPQCRTMSPAVLEKMADLVKEGATLIGQPPQAAPGLSDRAVADAKVTAIAIGLWGERPSESGERQIGQGRVIWGRPFEEIVQTDGLKGDMEMTPPELFPIRPGLGEAKWIWHSEDDQNPPPCERFFRSTIEIPEKCTVNNARLTMTADNEFVLSLNGMEICRGDRFNQIIDADIPLSLFHSGKNDVRVRAINGGDGPNPAGLIVNIHVGVEGRGRIGCTTGRTVWESSTGNDNWITVKVLGQFGCDPWGSIKRPPEATSLTWIHRRTQDADIFFLANPVTQPVDVTVTVRDKFTRSQLFDPLDGSIRDLPETRVESDGRTAIPLHFESEQALFLVLRDGEETIAHGRNFPQIKPIVNVEGPWQVTFDAQWVKPLPVSFPPDSKELTVKFDRLDDWRWYTGEGIRNYSGLATYRAVIDATGTTGDQLMYMETGLVKEMARVIINGQDLGVVWSPPWRVRIPEGLLKEKRNELQIIVANTWNNRLAADNALPENERLTHVGHNLHNSAAQQGLQPAGLLGPVRILVAE